VSASPALLILRLLAAGSLPDGATPPGSVSTGTSPADRPLFLASFPVEANLRGGLFGPGTRAILRFDPQVARPARQPTGSLFSNELVRRLGRPIGKDGRLVVAKLAYPAARERPGKADLASSFVIDYQEPPMRPVIAEARARLGPAPSVEGVVRFVDAFIIKKDVSRSFDVASVVARRREGDCTEHAVLLAALARALGIPARVAEGIVLMEVQRRVYAFGHAWVEVYRDGAWQPADAALVGGGPRVYLPLQLLTDETPSYFMSSARTTAGTLAVRGVVVTDDR
jgi:transglutaminase-like putative cysteine protease